MNKTLISGLIGLTILTIGLSFILMVAMSYSIYLFYFSLGVILSALGIILTGFAIFKEEHNGNRKTT